MNAARLLALLALLAVACSPPRRDDDTPDTCPTERVCGDGCCPANQTCNADTHECVSGACTKTNCSAAGAQCGQVPDGCGGTLDCGACAEGAACGADHQCPGHTCVSNGCGTKNCGELVDNCGTTITCGTCTGQDTCAGAGEANVCGHPPSACEVNPRSCYQLCVPFPEEGAFGTVDVGASKTVTFRWWNCGGSNFELRAFDLTPGPFALVSPPALPVVLTPGAAVDLVVSFTPTASGRATATLGVTTSYGGATLQLTGDGHVVPPACDEHTRPTINVKILNLLGQDITANPTVVAPTTIQFDASASNLPRGSGTYAWSLFSRPPGSASQLATTSSPSKDLLTLDQAGDYTVALTITDPTGCASFPGLVTAHATAQPTSNQRLRIELTWTEAIGDVDLHLLGPGGVFGDTDPTFGGGTDCFYANCAKGQKYSIDWGKNGTSQADNVHTNDPTLDADALWGHGPEIISDNTPFDATYTPVGYYYCSRAPNPSTSTGVSTTSSGPVNATMRIYVDGVMRREFTQQMTQRDKWTPATIVVSGSNVTVNAITSNFLVKTTGVNDACTTDRN